MACTRPHQPCTPPRLRPLLPCAVDISKRPAGNLKCRNAATQDIIQVLHRLARDDISEAAASGVILSALSRDPAGLQVGAGVGGSAWVRAQRSIDWYESG